MARRPARRRPETPIDATLPDRDRIIAALMALLAERRYEEIDLADIAGRAGVSLAALRAEFDSKLAILAAHAKEIDRKVLAGGEADMAEEPPRERLFDVLMRRFEAMAGEKEALRSLMRSALCNPPLALALNAIAVRSQQWMLAAAGISAAGPKGMVRAQGLACDLLVREGYPATVIEEAAAELGVDLIVIGTRGHTGLKHLLLGSIAERVVQKAPCAVLTVKPHPKAT